MLTNKMFNNFTGNDNVHILNRMLKTNELTFAIHTQRGRSVFLKYAALTGNVW